MPFGLGNIPLAGELWAARPKPLGALWGGAKGGGKGAVWGGAAGLTAGGPWGAVAGAAAGAGIGVALGTLSVATRRLSETMARLEHRTRSIIEQYKAYSPVIARLRHQWMLLDRRLNRIWADTLAPTLKKLTDIGTEFRERWTRLKVDFFQAVEPYLRRLLSVFHTFGRITFGLFEKFLKVIESVVNALTKVLRFLNLLPEERARTQALSPYEMEWPTIEGPLTGAMRRAGITGPPFTTEEARRPAREEKENERTKELRWLRESGLLRGEPGAPAHDEFDKPLVMPDVNVNVNVSDSKELSAAFERVWREATYELRKVEAGEMYKVYMLQGEGSYV